MSKIPNKYRRQFDWRLSEGEERRPLSDAAAMVRLSSSDFPDILEDFLSISRKRQKNPTAIARLQIHMIEELITQEGAIKHYRNTLKDLETQESGGDAERHKRNVEFNKRERFFHRLYANTIRAIGDGIAWRALGYDRAVTRLLGERATKQQITSEGTINELREWSYHFETGAGIAVLNAITNCLAIGDVTVVRNDGTAEIVEVKSSKTKSSRKIRQKQAMAEVVTLIATGEGQNDGRDVRIETLPICPETSLHKVEELLGLAEREGWAARKVNDCLYIEAFDFRKLERVDDLNALTESARKTALSEWENKGDIIHDFNTLDAIAYSPNCAPFSIFPFRARTCVEILIGAKCYITFLNLSAVAREFEKRGWTIEKDFMELAKEGNKESFLRVQKGAFHCDIPPGDYMRLQVETLRPKTIIDACELKLRQGPNADQGYLLALYEGELKLWN